MKKTERISLGGMAFTVGADAYFELERYLDDIRECFINDSSAGEIVEDIEERIAELLREKCKDGTVVSLSMVQEIKRRIGDPKELAGQNDDSSRQDSDTKQPKKRQRRDRRLYRNVDDRMLAGVCSGLACYFNIDKVLFRVAFLIAFCLGFFEAEDALFTISLVGYIILWIAMPAARTVEQKCEMRSQPIGLNEFRTKERDIDREVQETISSPTFRTIGRVVGIIIGAVLIACGLAGFASSIFFPSVPEIVNRYLQFDSLIGEEIVAAGIACNNIFWWLVFGCVGLASLGMLYGGIMLCFNFKSPSWRPGLVIFIFWVISVMVLVAWVLREIAVNITTLV